MPIPAGSRRSAFLRIAPECTGSGRKTPYSDSVPTCRLSTRSLRNLLDTYDAPSGIGGRVRRISFTLMLYAARRHTRRQSAETETDA
jgi:hypothetical protein